MKRPSYFHIREGGREGERERGRERERERERDGGASIAGVSRAEVGLRRVKHRQTVHMIDIQKDNRWAAVGFHTRTTRLKSMST